MTILEKILYFVLIVVLFTAGGYFAGYTRAQKIATNAFNAKTAEVLSKTLKESNQKILDFNASQNKELLNAIKESENRQKIRDAGSVTKNDLQVFFNQNAELFVNCKLEKEQIDKINEKLK